MENRENRLNKLHDEIETWSGDEKIFVLWNLLRWYGDNLNIPEHVETIEEYKEAKLKHDLLVSCNELIDMLNFELWR